jgi:fused signal recognition particle receptor
VAFPSFSKKLFAGLTRTREGLAGTLRSVFGAERIDDATLEDLETTLLAADLGPALTQEVLDAVRREGAAKGPREAVRKVLRDALGEGPGEPPAAGPPRVVFVVGVNGGGKTTTVGKLAALERGAGRSVLIVAADTFRAAAIDQLERWAERAGAELLKQREGADPAAVVFDALKAARRRGIEIVLVDTAGRLHTKTNLMAELEKLARVAGKEVPGAPHDVLLVVDATTGQNGLAQAEEFARAARLTGVVLTKLDGTAKGGVALGIRRKLGLAVRYVGVGEGLDDLLPFDPGAFVDGLIG